jgi:hypothetical protein
LPAASAGRSRSSKRLSSLSSLGSAVAAIERTPLDVCGRALDRGRVESEALKPREACRPAAELAAEAGLFRLAAEAGLFRLAAEAGLFRRGADAGRPSFVSETAELCRALLCSVNRRARMAKRYKNKSG